MKSTLICVANSSLKRFSSSGLRVGGVEDEVIHIHAYVNFLTGGWDGGGKGTSVGAEVLLESIFTTPK